MNITGRTILITGGTSGLGLGLAERLQAEGNTVIVAGRRTELLRRIEREHPGMVGVELDVADPASIARVAREVTDSYPALDTVITMAGIMEREDLRTAGFLQTAERIVTTNLLGTIRTVAAFTEHLQTRPESTIMTVSSGLAFVPLAATPTYSATKSAVHAFTEILRLQLAETSVEVVELVPPAVATTLMGQDRDDTGRAMPVDDYLDEVMTLLRDQPDAPEVLVERVKTLRYATAEGRYPEVLARLAGSH